MPPLAFVLVPPCAGVPDSLLPFSPSLLGPPGEATALAEPEAPVFLRPNRLRELLGSLLLMRNAAVCKAVAAAALLAKCARAVCNLVAHSGRILSVRMTLGAVAERDCVQRRLPTPMGDATGGERAPELSELVDDIAVFRLPNVGGGIRYVGLGRNAGGL